MRKLTDERQANRDVEPEAAALVDEFARVRFRLQSTRQRDRTKTPPDDRHFDLLADCFDCEQNLERPKAFRDDVAAFMR